MLFNKMEQSLQASLFEIKNPSKSEDFIPELFL
jgi:hypothetical protein